MTAARALEFLDSWGESGDRGDLAHAVSEAEALAGGTALSDLALLECGWAGARDDLLSRGLEGERDLARSLAAFPPAEGEVADVVAAALAAFEYCGDPHSLARAETLGRRLPDGGDERVRALRAALRRQRGELDEGVRVSLVGNPADPVYRDLLAPLRRLRWPTLTLVPVHALIGTHYDNRALNPSPMAHVEAPGLILPPSRSAAQLVEALRRASNDPGWLRRVDRLAA
jgi:hypothetical protein